MTKRSVPGLPVRLLSGCALLLGAWACGPEIPPFAVSTPAPAASEAAPATTTDESQAVMYVYSPVGKRDPFRNPATLPRPGARQNPGQVMSVLQRYDIDQLRLVFTYTATSSPMAMVLDPEGRSHMVQIGDFIGKNWGKVSAIKRQEITITETMVDPNSQRVFPNYIPMRMKETADEKMQAKNYQLKILGNEGSGANDSPANIFAP